MLEVYSITKGKYVTRAEKDLYDIAEDGPLLVFGSSVALVIKDEIIPLSYDAKWTYANNIPSVPIRECYRRVDFPFKGDSALILPIPEIHSVPARLELTYLTDGSVVLFPYLLKISQPMMSNMIFVYNFLSVPEIDVDFRHETITTSCPSRKVIKFETFLQAFLTCCYISSKNFKAKSDRQNGDHSIPASTFSTRVYFLTKTAADRVLANEPIPIRTHLSEVTLEDIELYKSMFNVL